MTEHRDASPRPGDHHFLRSARLVSLLTLVSRLSGFVRDVAFGYFFGATGLASAFAVAFTVPNLFRRLFGEGALSAALIPVLSRRLHEEGPESGANLTGQVFAWLGVVVAGLVLAGELALLVLWRLWAGPGRPDLVLAMTGLLLPYAVLICLVAAAGGVLNVRGRFAVPAGTPILLNLILIAALFGGHVIWPGAPVRRIWVLAWAVLGAGVVQLLVQLWALRRAGSAPRWGLGRDDPGLGEIAWAMVPMMVGMAAVQINTLGDTIVALTCVPYGGAPAVLYFAQRLYQFPLGVFSLAFATAVFPTLSAHAAAGDRASLAAAMAKSVRVVFYVGVAATLGLIVTAWPLVQGLFERGEFTAEGTRRVAPALVAYAAGVWAYGLNHILVRGFYAMGDRRTPMRVALIMVAINLGFNLTLVWRWQEAGLGAATAITGAVQFLWLVRILAGRLAPLPWGELVGSAARSLAGGAVMAALVVGVDRILDASSVELGPMPRLAVLVPVGITSYLLATTLLRSRELQELLSR